MKIIRKDIEIGLTADEYDILAKAQDILLKLEEETSTEECKQIEELYTDYVEGVKSQRAMTTATDFLGMLKRECIIVGGEENEI